MSKKLISYILAFVLLSAVAPAFVTSNINAASIPNIKQEIRDWKITPSQGLTTSMGTVGVADQLALDPNYSTASWQNAKVPGSVLGNLVDDGYYDSLFGGKDVYYNDNLYKIPVSDFAKPWWYRTEFEIPADQIGKKILLTFEGINYAADVYVNGVAMENQHVSVPEEMLLNHNSDGSLGPNGGALNTSGTGATSINYAVSATPAAGAQQLHTMKRDTLQPGNKYNDGNYNVYSKQFIGGYRTYELDVTNLATAGKNIICVKVQAPYYIRDLSWMWIDWITAPPDNNMGLTGKVFVSTSNDVRVSNPFVSSKVAEDLNSAQLKLYADLSEMANQGNVTGQLIATIKKPDGSQLARLTKNVTVSSGAYLKEVEFNSTEFPELNVQNPELWWPYLSGDQPLYNVNFDFVISGEVSHSISQRFGIREVGAEINVSPYSLGDSTALTTSTNSSSSDSAHVSQMIQIYINHRPILLKGGGATPTDLLWRKDDAKNKAAVDYAKYMGLNMLRDEGKFDRNLVDYMDEQGIVLLSGWACCDRWQEPGRLNKGERFIAYESLYSVLRYFRQHAAFVNMANGSDEPPSKLTNGANGASVEYGYFVVEAKTRLHEHATIVASGAAYLASNVTNGTASAMSQVGGMHMNEAYDYMQPKFFYEYPLGSYGFVSEGGGSPSIPVIETIKKILPNDQLWPYNIGDSGGKSNNGSWQLHAARGNFRTYDWFNRPLDIRYGSSETLEKYIMKASMAAYEMQRAHFESFNLHRYTNATGVVAWMYNNAWPMMFWNLYDNFMNPNGSTFGARIANEPVHIMYDPYNKEISVVNSTQKTYPGAVATATIYDINGNIIGSLTKNLNVEKDLASATVGAKLSNGNTVSRVDKKVGLQLDASGNLVNKTYKYYGQINDAYGVTKMWTDDELTKALTGPLSNVYFLRLELKDASNKSISINSYPISIKDDLIKYSSWTYRYTPSYEFADLTLLNELPAVSLDIVTNARTEGNLITETVAITNDKVKNNGAIAYAVELKARIDENNLVAPVFYSDNLFTLYPGETREITITYDKSTYAGYAAIEYNCYNNVCNSLPSVRSATTRSSLNLAYKKAVTVSSLYSTSATYQASNATDGIANNTTDNILNNTTSSNLATVWSHASADQTPWLYVDLGSVQSIDRVKTYWNYVYRPEKLVVEISTDLSSWREVAVCVNSVGSAYIDCVLPETMPARYVKIWPSGKRGAIAAKGVTSNILGATSWNGTLSSNTAGTFELCGIEVYRFNPSVFLDIVGDGSVTIGSKTYTLADNANDRLITLEPNDSITLNLASNAPQIPIMVLKDGVDVSGLLDANNQIVFSEISNDTNIKIVFDGSALSEKIYAERVKSDSLAKAIVKSTNAMLIVAVYDNKDRLVGLKQMTSDVETPEWRLIALSASDILSDLNNKKVKVFLWNSNSYVPIADYKQVN